ncbi:MAG: preprotein translocase subunit SecY, partial [Thermoplasmata archaeon]|nr:preprotein translocase subunit SecY [Thermoplasmata archaeon]
MAEEKKSKLYALKPLIERWPAVARPEGHVPFRSKLFWTILCLILYYILATVPIYGVSGTALDMFADYRAIMAGASGSIMHLGIGPIVTASIILQLFVGAKIINLDLTKKEDKAIYQGFQKILVIVMI